MNPVTSFLVAVFAIAGAAIAYWNNLYFSLPFFAIGVLIGLSVKMANAWQKFVILRLGKLQSVREAVPDVSASTAKSTIYELILDLCCPEFPSSLAYIKFHRDRLADNFRRLLHLRKVEKAKRLGGSLTAICLKLYV